MSRDPYDNMVEHYASLLRYMADMAKERTLDTESPIETLLSVSMELAFSLLNFKKSENENGKWEFRDCLIVREAQKRIENYRVDFLFTLQRGDVIVTQLIIECDGHEFHERTKDQAARDRSRDRDLTNQGFTVMRFTGSELYRDAAACSRDACNWLIKAMEG